MMVNHRLFLADRGVMKKYCAILLSFLCLSHCYASILSVPSGYSSIQSAIDNAADNDTIIVSPGIYPENINFLGKAITVSSVNPDDPATVAATVIDGSIPDDPNNASVVTFNSGEDNDSVLTGFTITGGTGTWLVIAWDLHAPYWNRCGGGVVCYNMSQPTITKNVFSSNSTGEGGGIYVYGNPVNIYSPSDPPVHITPVISDNTFTNNSAIKEHGFSPPDNNYVFAEHGDGGAIVCFQGVDPVIKNNLIQLNHADSYGGGMHLRQWSHGIIEDNQIISNDSRLGAGIHITYSSSPTIKKNLIQSNIAGNLGGGGIYVYYLSDPLIEQNLILQNVSANGAGIAIKYSSFSTIRNNIIKDNIDGAGIDVTGSSPTILHNTIINHSPVPSRPGGICCIGSTNVVIENNIIASNSNAYGIYLEPSVNAIIRYNDIWNNDLGQYYIPAPEFADLESNISTDPQFVDTSGHLDYTSGCIDAGDPNFITAVGEVDIDSDSRILNSRTDIGADEVLPVWNLTDHKQFSAIQNAIDNAANGDVIVAIAGRYMENISFNNKSITLRSVSPTDPECIDKTIIDGGNNNSATVTFGGNENTSCAISGFTVMGANNSGPGGGFSGNGTSAALSFCAITNNNASHGAGIYDCDGMISNCKINNNYTTGSGGGLSDCDGEISNSFITDNYAGISGGAMYNCNGNITGNTITKNTAVVTGGGLADCAGNIVNSIVWDNSAPVDNSLNNCSTPTYSCLQDPVSGQENIYSDPLFIDPANADYHLMIYSDCIDAGDSNSVSPLALTDCDLEPRISPLVYNITEVVDIGADEVLINRSDFNIDGSVDMPDFLELAAEWLDSGGNLLTDIATDQSIDYEDYGLFTNDWRWLTPWHSTYRQSALEFDSSLGGYVKIETPQGCILNNNYTFTYTAWVYQLGYSIDARIIGKNERALMVHGGILKGYSNGYKLAMSISVNNLLKIGRWHFVAMTRSIFDDQRVHLYVDGTEVEYQAQILSPTISHPHPDFRIEPDGSYVWDLMIGSQAWYPGSSIPHTLIDEVAIYSHVLTSDELKYLYNNGAGRPTPLDMGPIGLWRLDDTLGTTVLDSSGNNNHGTLQGPVLPKWKNGKFLKY